MNPPTVHPTGHTEEHDTTTGTVLRHKVPVLSVYIGMYSPKDHRVLSELIHERHFASADRSPCPLTAQLVRDPLVRDGGFRETTPGHGKTTDVVAGAERQHSCISSYYRNLMPLLQQHCHVQSSLQPLPAG